MFLELKLQPVVMVLFSERKIMLEGVFEGGDPQLAEQSCTTTESSLFKYTETVPAINKLKNIMTVFVLPIQGLDPATKSNG